MTKNIRKSMALLPMSIVMKLTELTARQIRYYEDHSLLVPARTEGNKRMFSLNDVDRLLEIKDLLDQGINIAGIKRIFEMKDQPVEWASKAPLSDAELRKMLRIEMQEAGRMNRSSLRQGDLSRFYH
ncbi:MerR family transcriptional regulator [Paenisporosarcina cavernae]|uniref:MerR family transcriptional regulator n=1 Tax=Paenisporosarcina cavernae TaxID=2320858 RepID=A0A385YS44_9BACL|nr:MerR family transcriptional regulator [Paenisporosarcina cavernae]AYC29324.1 MerR family transcriptional regulator [Paenisporosarcina cavernae]